MPAPANPSPPDLRCPAAALPNAALCERARVAVAAGRRAEHLAGAAFERLAVTEGTAGPRVEGLAHGCPPTLTGFAAVHAGLAPSETADLRLSARMHAAMPDLSAARADGTLTESSYRRLRAVATPRTLEAWLARARAESPATFHARLAVAAEGDTPEGVDPRHAAVADGPLPSGAWRLACAVPFTAEQHDTWWRASQHVRARAMRTLSTADIVERLVAALASQPAPASFAALTPRREWQVDPLRQVAWLQTGRGRLQVPLASVPPPPAAGAPRRDAPSVHVLRADGTPVPLLPESLLAAFPELRGSRWDPESDLGADDAAEFAPERGAPEGAGAAVWPPRPAAEVVAGAEALAVAAAVFSNPVLPPVSPPLTRALAASAGRVSHAIRAVLVESLAELAHRSVCGELAEDALDLLRGQLGLSARDLREATRVGRALRRLPALNGAFRTGRASYTKVRAACRKATPATDTAWAGLVQRVDTAAVEAFAEATPPGAPPPATPACLAPLRPAGELVREGIYAVLEGPAGPRMASLRQTLERLAGRPLDTAEALAALAGWYLAAHAPRRRDAVIYQRSPESRVPGRGRDALSPALATLSSVTARLAAAIPHASPALADPPRARRAWARLAALTASRPGPQPMPKSGPSPMPVPRPTPEPHTSPTPSEPSSRRPLVGRRRIPTLIRAAVRWRDGEVCVVPGCGNALVVQHDHGTPVAQGGRADVIRDHRLCGPCNRAKHRGEIHVWPRPDGTVEVTDAAGTAMGEGPLEGADLDAVLFARCWAEGVRDVAAMTLPSAPARADPAPLTVLASAG